MADNKSLGSPTAVAFETQGFDIAAAYDKITQRRPELPRPLAAVEALTEAVEACQPQTISHTITLLSQLSDKLQGHDPTSLPFGAGMEMFRRQVMNNAYLHAAKDSAAEDGTPSHTDFGIMRKAIVEFGHTFVEDGVKAGSMLEDHVVPFMWRECIVIVPSYSASIERVLFKALAVNRNFRVVLVEMLNFQELEQAQKRLASRLKAESIPTAVVPVNALARAVFHDLAPDSEHRTMVLASGVALSREGGVFGPLGTLLAAAVARQTNAEIHMMAETYRETNCLPIGASGLGNPVVHFTTNDFTVHNDRAMGRDPLDYTPPELIDYVINEKGWRSPTAIAENAILNST